MSLPLPPLNAIRAFEAAARHLSFKEAASELGVTNGAVSLQIKNLEDSLGVRLFDRRARGVTLTAEGEHYFRAARTAFRILKDSTSALTRSGNKVLTVSCTLLFASQWLVPRLSAFQRHAPKIDVRLSTPSRIVDFAKDGIDLAIRHGLGRYTGLLSEKIVGDDLVVVCSPKLVKRGRPLRGPDELCQFPLLHDEHDDDWRLWFAATGVKSADWPAGPIFSDITDLVAATIDGQGIALIRESMVENELRNGRLVRPLGTKLKTDLAYYLVYPLGALDRHEAQIFRDWLLDQAACERSRVTLQK